MDKQSGLNKFIRHILETCNLPLNNMDKLPKDKPPTYRHSDSKENSTSESESSAFTSDAIFGTEEFEFLHQKTQRHMREVTLR